MHEMKLQKEPFEKISDGIKTIEMRLYDEKRQKIKINDIIKFTNVDSNEVITVRVMKLYIFPDFEHLYNKFDKADLGYNKEENAYPEDMKQYYSTSDIKQYGVVAIKIERI